MLQSFLITVNGGCNHQFFKRVVPLVAISVKVTLIFWKQTNITEIIIKKIEGPVESKVGNCYIKLCGLGIKLRNAWKFDSYFPLCNL